MTLIVCVDDNMVVTQLSIPVTLTFWCPCRSRATTNMLMPEETDAEYVPPDQILVMQGRERYRL